MLPLDARVMALLDTVNKKTINVLWVISTAQPNFSRLCTITRRLLTHGVSRKLMRDILACVTQKKLNSKKAKI